MQPVHFTPTSVILKTIVTHTVTYFLMGVISFLLLDYTTRYAAETIDQFMRPTNDRLVMAGPLFQPLRGLLFGLVIYLLRVPFLEKPRGWLVLWATLAVVGIFATYGAAPGSIEGVIYTKLPLSFHLNGLPETLIQSLIFSGLLYYWVNHPEKKWLTWIMSIIFVIVVLLPALGLIAG